MTTQTLRIRRSIQELQDAYTQGNKKPLEDLMRAWKGVKELPPDDPRSFFKLGGFHGEPFRGAGWGNASYWGGYCNHGNVLFPTWHRMYLVKLEEALRGVPGCEDVTLPYWDETSEESTQKGIPWALTVKDFELDGESIPNPLRSFVFNQAIVDHIDHDKPSYSKPKGYETVRYPLSGLVGSKEDLAATRLHNKRYSDYDKNVELLNANVVNWLNSIIIVDDKPVSTHVADKYKSCLEAPNYTVFSNNSSAAQWNGERPGTEPVVPLEEPHDSIHLAVGGFDYPGATDYSPIDGANGDMGENDTAGLDPIFFFHHCNVDRVFWLWQKRQGFTDHLDIIAGYPGTNSVDGQGATPGVAPNSWLGLESPLAPFKQVEQGRERDCTSLDCINIERQLGFTYSKGSLEDPAELERMTLKAGRGTQALHVTGINRAPIRGSFLVSAFANIGGKRHHVGTRAVLSRWNVSGCANCQTHLEVQAFFGLHAFPEKLLQGATYEVEIRGRDGVLANHAKQTGPTGKRLFHLEVK
ncbi:tyrosinase family protein [Myxococcus eversor]|uniref:tyrosinase family protein n=1 Tax=Myxococcus eversor TaxID=2709661 RepID=UPI0013D40804|nr:tyrosinase family protein [Myxococcus eversor]